MTTTSLSSSPIVRTARPCTKMPTWAPHGSESGMGSQNCPASKCSLSASSPAVRMLGSSALAPTFSAVRGTPRSACFRRLSINRSRPSFITSAFGRRSPRCKASHVTSRTRQAEAARAEISRALRRPSSSASPSTLSFLRTPTRAPALETSSTEPSSTTSMDSAGSPAPVMSSPRVYVASANGAATARRNSSGQPVSSGVRESAGTATSSSHSWRLRVASSSAASSLLTISSRGPLSSGCSRKATSRATPGSRAQ
mmetsp:Transcript_104874/g.328284  ORF Transcript_104874/g.328284 Transcript_104874/m.328284 type:complete len:255 (+) Transcript_104874:611-1375(+)